MARRNDGRTAGRPGSARPGWRLAVLDATEDSDGRCGIRRTVIRPAFHQPMNPFMQRARKLGTIVAQRTEGVGKVGGDDLLHGFPFEGAVHGEQIIKNAAERVKVSAAIKGTAFKLLRSHIKDGTHHGAIGADRLFGGFFKEPGEAEVDEFADEGAICQPRDLDVGGLDIAMQQVEPVGVAEGIKGLLGDFVEIFDGHGRLGDRLFKIPSVEVFHDDTRAVRVVRQHVINRDDVRMLHGGEHGGLPHEIGINGSTVGAMIRGEKTLDGNGPLEPGIPCPKDDADPALIDFSLDLIP